MGGIGLPELLIVLVIIMIVFGAGKIPQIGSAFGKTIRNFKKSMKEEEEKEVSIEEIAKNPELDKIDENKAVPENLESSKEKGSPKEPSE